MLSSVRAIAGRALIVAISAALGLSTVAAGAASTLDELIEQNLRAWSGEPELLSETCAPDGVHTAIWRCPTRRGACRRPTGGPGSRERSNAFERIVNVSFDRCLGVAMRLLHDSQAAEDAVQQAMVNIWRDLPRLRDPSRYDAWSYSQAPVILS